MIKCIYILIQQDSSSCNEDQLSSWTGGLHSASTSPHILGLINNNKSGGGKIRKLRTARDSFQFLIYLTPPSQSKSSFQHSENKGVVVC